MKYLTIATREVDTLDQITYYILNQTQELTQDTQGIDYIFDLGFNNKILVKYTVNHVTLFKEENSKLKEIANINTVNNENITFNSIVHFIEKMYPLDEHNFQISITSSY